MMTFVDNFLAQTEKNRNRPAVMDFRGTDTYAQVNMRSALLAKRILDDCSPRGIKAGTRCGTGGNAVRVALLLPRTRVYMTALIAVVRAGCAAVPLDAEYPSERIQSILKSAGCSLCVTTDELAEKAAGQPICIMEEATQASPGEEPDENLNLSDPDKEGLLLFTSGSTGRPKGVIHRQQIFSCGYETLRNFHTFTENDVIGCMAGFTFIASIQDLIPPLMVGGSTYIFSEDERKNVDMLHAIIQKRRLTGMFLPPQMFEVMREMYGRLPLEYVLLAGEKFRCFYPEDGNLVEAYGTSESAGILYHRVENDDSGLLGRPADGVRVFLMDEQGNSIDQPGEIGELCVVSPWLAIGYDGLPDETATRFVSCPFAPGRTMFRTGDYMSRDEKGNMFFHGRKDRMVKLRGYRVELGEIENAVKHAENVTEAACVVVKVLGGDKLCCYYTGDENIDPAGLKSLLALSLPEYMVPDYFARLCVMPRNERNKVDYLALQPMDPPKDAEYVSPENETEEQVCAAYAKALGLPRVSVLSDFFDLGGTSISVSALIAALMKDRRGLSFKDVVNHPTPRALAAFLTEETDPLQDQLQMDREFYPLTKTQMGIYLESLTGGNDATYTSPYLMKADPSLRPEQLIAAVEAVLAAHPSMKYVIRTDAKGIPHMVMTPDAKVEIPVIEGLEQDRLEFMKRSMPVIPLKDGLLFHFAVYRTLKCCYLAVKSHLIFMDGTSVSLLIAELNRALTGKSLLKEEYTIQRVGMLEEQRVTDGSHSVAEQYHRDLFKAMEDLPSLTGDLDEPLTPGMSKNLRYEPGSLKSERVKAFCAENQITESSFFMGAMALMLGKYLNTKHVSFSTVYNGRALSETTSTIGTLIKRIPVYGNLEKNMPVEEYLRDLSHQLFVTMSYDIFSFDEVLKTCPVNEDVEFIYQGDLFTDQMGMSEGRTLLEGDNWFMERYHTGMVTGCMSIQFFSTGGFYNMTIEYRNERFTENWVHRFAENLFIVSEGLLEKRTIGEIEMLTDADREMLRRFNETAVPMDFLPVHEQIHHRALLMPEKPAVISAGKTLTFHELDLLSAQVASALRERGVTPETLVGVLLERTVWAYVAEIGILKSGGAFVPFIPDYPDERIDFCMKDGHISMMLTTEDLLSKRKGLIKTGCRMVTLEELFGKEKLCSIEADEAFLEQPGVKVMRDNLAYCIYTSGTTGQPKGVMIEHRNIANYVHRNEKSPEIIHYTKPGRVCLALASFSFDVSVVEEFVPLCSGNTVVIATEEEIHTPKLLAKLIRENNVTGITCTPTYLLNLIDIQETREAIRQITFFDIGAEAFPANLYDRLKELRTDSVILNVYGPTETTMGCAAEELTGRQTINVGPPIANTVFAVVDTFGNDLPAGIQGELMICGDQVGRGYINLPEKTKESFFVRNGLRAYRSGDLAAWTEDGKIRLFGRLDNQVKLRGFRIELDEIERVIAEYPGISQSAVAVKKGTGVEFLAGYYVAAKEIDQDALKRSLKEKLPEYMVPAVLTELTEMPRSVNGKINRQALPGPDIRLLKAEFVPPVTETEKKICAAVEKVLNLPDGSVGLEDDFFNLGGDSLSSMIVAEEAKAEGLTSADIFKYRTLGRIAWQLQKKSVSFRSDLDRLEARARHTSHLLTPLQTELLDLQLFYPESANLSVYRFLVRFEPDVDAPRLCEAVNRMIENHPALSMKFFFDEDNNLRQQYDPLIMPPVRLRDISPATEEALSDILVRPFDRLLDASLCKIEIFRGLKGSYLYMNVHHLLADGASLDIILRDIVNAYFGRELKKDYYLALLSMEEERILSGQLEEDEKYHMNRYGETDWCVMPYSANATVSDRGGEFKNHLCFTVEQVQSAEKRLGVSLSVLQIASVLLALSRVTGKEDTMVAWTYNNRMSPESEDAVGIFAKNLTVACHMNEINSMRELLDSVKEQVVSGITHSTYNYTIMQYFNHGKPWVESNLQINMGGIAIEALHPELIELGNIYNESPGNVMLAILTGNEHGDGAFDFLLTYDGSGCSRDQVQRYHHEIVHILEELILRENADLIAL